MRLSLPTLPQAQLDPLRQAYDGAVAARRRHTLIGLAILCLAVLVSARTAEVQPARLIGNIGDFLDYFGRLFVFDGGRLKGHAVWTDLPEWYWGLGHWLSLLLDTVLIAYLATLAGAVGGFVLCFLAARNIAPSALARGPVKRVLELCRTVPEIVFALMFVAAFGLGPLAGVLAIAIHTLGANGKLFTEVVENIDLRPLEGARAAGATWVETVRFGALPQVWASFASYTLLRFEVNVRGASVMGFVGAGGIGQDLIEAIRKFYYADVSAILLLIIATVFILDMASQRLRRTLTGLA